MFDTVDYPRAALSLGLTLALAGGLLAQDAVEKPQEKQEQEEKQEQAAPKLPEIADEPKTVDPATFMPEPLARRATVDLSDSSLLEVIDWLSEQGIEVLLNKRALADAGLLPTEPVSERLNDQPLYFLLHRLKTIDMGWYFKDGILHLVPIGEEYQRFTTSPYNIGDLLDAGHDVERLMDVIESAVDRNSWESVGGPGAISSLGDVLLVRHTDQVQRKVKGLLTALRKHGRMTFILDPPQHEVFRQKLQEPVSVDFQDTPLETAVATLAEKSGVDIRLDMRALRDVRIRQREPITVSLADFPLSTVLKAMLMELDLSYLLRDGVVWVTSAEEAESHLKTAVYDVRDLCRDEGEADALHQAISSQAAPDSWSEVGGPGNIIFAQPGTMVVIHQEKMLLEVLGLLETYRTALRASKPRDREAEYDQEIITVYYRMTEAVAEDLKGKLPQLVEPESWQSEKQPEAPGEMLLVASPPKILAASAQSTSGGEVAAAPAYLSQQAVLIITQTRANHDKIAGVMVRVENGDAVGTPKFKGGMGGGGGGFGGGFFSVPSSHR